MGLDWPLRYQQGLPSSANHLLNLVQLLWSYCGAENADWRALNHVHLDTEDILQEPWADTLPMT